MRGAKIPSLIELLLAVWVIAVMVLFFLQFAEEIETGLGVVKRALGLG
jgi:hypothetical protein